MKILLFIITCFSLLPTILSAENDNVCNLTEEEFYNGFAEEIIGEWSITNRGGFMTVMGMTMPVKPQPTSVGTIYKVGDTLMIGQDGESAEITFVSDRKWNFEPDGDNDILVHTYDDFSLAAGCNPDDLLPQLHYSGTIIDDGGTFTYDAYLVFGTTNSFLGFANGVFRSPDGAGSMKLHFDGNQIQ